MSKRTEWASSLQVLLALAARVAAQLLQRAAQDALDGEAPVERRVGVLEDDLQRAHVVAPALGDLLLERLPVELDDRALVGLDEAEQRARERRLAAAGLADQAERLARPQDEVDVVHRADVVALLAEGLAQALGADHRLGVLVDRLERGLLRRRPRQLVRLLPEVAAAVAPAAEVVERRLLLRADLLREPAAVDEHAGRQVGAELRQEAGDRVQPLLVLAHAAARQAAQQADRVGVARVVEDVVDRALLDEPPRVEHADAVAHLRDHVEVVADEQDARAELLAQRGDEVEHLGLDRGVEARSSARRGSAASGPWPAPWR